MLKSNKLKRFHGSSKALEGLNYTIFEFLMTFIATNFRNVFFQIKIIDFLTGFLLYVGSKISLNKKNNFLTLFFENIRNM